MFFGPGSICHLDVVQCDVPNDPATANGILFSIEFLKVSFLNHPFVFRDKQPRRGTQHSYVALGDLLAQQERGQLASIIKDSLAILILSSATSCKSKWQAFCHRASG